jgi:sugar (pentulose or hexulose) kinase
MDSELDVQRITDGLQTTLRRLASLAGGVAMVAAIVGIATFLTGLLVFDGKGRPLWLVIGGVICAVPLVAALVARFFVRSTAKHSPELIANVRQFVETSSNSAQVLIDHDAVIRRAAGTAASSAAALLRHSRSSSSGTESATTPAPAWNDAPCVGPTNIVRMAMAVSMLPLKST